MTDLSVVLTAHSETAVCGPTVRSADDAIAAARAEGITVEAIVALDRATEAITWFRQDWRYSFHPQAAVTVGNKIICDVPEFNYPLLPADGHEPGAWKDWPSATMHRWTLDLDTGGFHATQTDDRSIEFPTVDQRFSGLAHRYGYAAGASGQGEIVGGFD